MSGCWWWTSRRPCRSVTGPSGRGRAGSRSRRRRHIYPIWNCARSRSRKSATPVRRLFAEVDRALADIPRSRFAGTIAITDGQIHDVPKAAPGSAPLNLLLTAKGEETDRRLRVIEAPGYGIVGKSVTLRVAVDDLGDRRPHRSRQR